MFNVQFHVFCRATSTSTVRRSVPTDTFQALMVSLMPTRLDFGNSWPVFRFTWLHSSRCWMRLRDWHVYHLRQSDHVTDAFSLSLLAARAGASSVQDRLPDMKSLAWTRAAIPRST